MARPERPNVRNDTVWSFGRYARGESQIREPENVQEVRDFFRSYLNDPNPPAVVIRAGGHSFDGQAVHDRDKGSRIVLSAEKFRGEPPTIRYHRNAPKLVTLSAEVRWRDFLDDARTRAPIRIPASMQTGGLATVGGTLAGDCLSRFSGTMGKESESIESFKLLTPSLQPPGDGLTPISRTSHPDLFFAVIGGLGYLGFVTEATYRLVEIPADSVAHTEVTTRKSMASLLKRQRDVIREWQEQGRDEPLAVSSAAFINEAPLTHAPQFKGGVFKSWYGSPGPVWRPAWPLYGNVNDPGRWAAEYTARIDGINTLIHQALYDLARLATPPLFVNDIADFIFFMDGNTKAKEAYEALLQPRRFPIFQQTWVIPSSNATIFGDELVELLIERRIQPTELDVLFMRGNKCLLSAGYYARAMEEPPLKAAFTLGFERWTPSSQPKRPAGDVTALCEELNDRAIKYGGRIHLVKNVHVRRGGTQFRDMFGGTLDEFLRIKAQCDPSGLIRNKFFEHLLKN